MEKLSVQSTPAHFTGKPGLQVQMEKLLTDIKSFFPDFRIVLSDLQHPVFLVVRDFYARVLLELGVDVENIRKVQLEQFDLSDEIDRLPEFNLLTAIRTTFPFLEFRLSDLLEPSHKRNTMLMVKVMHFIQFCETRCSANNEEIEKFQEARNLKLELAHKREVEVNKLNNLVQEIDSYNQSKIQLEEKLQVIQRELEEDEMRNVRVAEELEKVKEEYINAEQSYDSLCRKLKSLSEEFELLKKETVNSPDKEEHELKARTKEKERLAETLRELKEKRKMESEMKSNLENFISFIQNDLLPLLGDLEIIKKLSEIEDTNNADNLKLNEITKKIENITKLLAEVDRNLCGAEEKFHVDKLILDNEGESLRSLLESHVSSLNNKLKEKQETRNKMKMELDRIDRKMNAIRLEYNDLLTNFNVINEKLVCGLVKK